MNLDRVTDAGRLNEIVNDPSVYPWVCGAATGPLDLGPMLADRQNTFALMGEHGGCLFVRHQAGLYEAHTQILPTGRGAWAVEMVQAALRWMFTCTEAVDILTRVPRGNVGAKALAHAIGGRHEFTAERGWVKDGAVIPAKIYTLGIQSWMASAPGLVEAGQWFHRSLDREFERLGRKTDLHPDDQAHDRYVGAAVEMMLGGQPAKAEVFYRRFAMMAGYVPFRVLGAEPLTVDIGNAILEVHGRNFFVVEAASIAAEQTMH